MNVSDDKQRLFSMLGIVEATDEVMVIAIRMDPMSAIAAEVFDYVRYNGNELQWYTKKYLEEVNISEFINSIIKMDMVYE